MGDLAPSQKEVILLEPRIGTIICMYMYMWYTQVYTHHVVYCVLPNMWS